MQFFFITTEHLETGVWFRDDEDFKVGMNYVAVEADITGVGVLVFILMSNHVHFVLACTRSEAQVFIDGFKKRYSMYYRRKYGVKELLRENGVRIQEVGFEGESLERAIAYTMMNCVAANICLGCHQYKWGTGDVFFNPNPSKGVPVSSLPVHRQQTLLHTFHRLPASYILGEDGYVLPSSYVKTRFVESVFRKPSRLNYFLQNSSKAKLRLSSDDDIPAFRDQTVIAGIPDLCHSLFRKTSLKELSREQTSELLRQLRRRYSADPVQLSRVTNLSVQEVVDLLDSI